MLCLCLQQKKLWKFRACGEAKMGLTLSNIDSNRVLTWEQMETVRLLKRLPGTYYQQASLTERTVMRDWMRSLMQKQPITVTFVKADGSLRDMLCTLNQDLIPNESLPKGAQSIDGLDSQEPVTPPMEPETMRVFDVEKQQWRSFRFDRVKKITVSLAWQ